MNVARIALALVLLAGCEPAGTQFKATVAQPDGSYPMPVVLGDRAGLVTGIDPATIEFSTGDLPAIQPDANDPNAMIVRWGTGACDDNTRLTLQASGTTYRLDIAVNSGFKIGGCTAQLLLRSLRIHFSTPVPAGSIAAFGGD